MNDVSNQDLRDVKESIHSIETNVEKLSDNFTAFCLTITTKITALEVRQTAYEFLNKEKENLQKEFADRLNKDTAKRLVILGLVITIAISVVNIVLKYL